MTHTVRFKFHRIPLSYSSVSATNSFPFRSHDHTLIINFCFQNQNSHKSSSSKKTEDWMNFGSPKINPPSSIPRHLLNSSTSSNLSYEFDFSDHSTDNSQTDDLISFTSNDFSTEPLIDDSASQPKDDGNTQLQLLESSNSFNANREADNAIISPSPSHKKLSNVPEYKVIVNLVEKSARYEINLSSVLGVLVARLQYS